MRPSCSSRPPDPAFLRSCDCTGGRQCCRSLGQSSSPSQKLQTKAAQVGRLFCALDVPERKSATARPTYLNTFLTITFRHSYMRGTPLGAREAGGLSMLPGG